MTHRLRIVVQVAHPIVGSHNPAEDRGVIKGCHWHPLQMVGVPLVSEPFDPLLKEWTPNEIFTRGVERIEHGGSCFQTFGAINIPGFTHEGTPHTSKYVMRIHLETVPAKDDEEIAIVYRATLNVVYSFMFMSSKRTTHVSMLNRIVSCVPSNYFHGVTFPMGLAARSSIAFRGNKGQAQWNFGHSNYRSGETKRDPIVGVEARDGDMTWTKLAPMVNERDMPMVREMFSTAAKRHVATDIRARVRAKVLALKKKHATE